MKERNTKKDFVHILWKLMNMDKMEQDHRKLWGQCSIIDHRQQQRHWKNDRTERSSNIVKIILRLHVKMYTIALQSTAVHNAASVKRYIISTSSTVASFAGARIFWLCLLVPSISCIYAILQDAGKYEGSVVYNIWNRCTNELLESSCHISEMLLWTVVVQSM